MKLEDVRSIAKLKGLDPAKLSKTRLIKTLQKREGNFDCFATASNYECDRTDCLWRADCFDAVKKGELS